MQQSPGQRREKARRCRRQVPGWAGWGAAVERLTLPLPLAALGERAWLLHSGHAVQRWQRVQQQGQQLKQQQQRQ